MSRTAGGNGIADDADLFSVYLVHWQLCIVQVPRVRMVSNDILPRQAHSRNPGINDPGHVPSAYTVLANAAMSRATALFE